jgi:transcriptional regulator with XRE-family HTH domain
MPKERQKTLDEIRYEHNLTQHQLAEASGASWATIAKLELGEHRPLPATLDKLAAVLGDEVYHARYAWRKVYRKRGRPRTKE